VVAAVLAAAVAGCGGGGDRDEVDSYIKQANSVQREFIDEFERANETYVAYSKNELAQPLVVRRLTAARDGIAEAGDRLGALEPPSDARALHSKLLRVYDMNLDFADQTVVLASYLEGAADALDPLSRANKRLRKDLAATGADAQVAALRRFVRSVDGALSDMRALEAPRVLTPTHRDQLARLQGTRDTAEKLRQALADQDSERVAALLKRFRRSGSPDSGAADLASQALDSYDRLYKQLNDAYADVQREQTRLEKELG
jgi:hypothetical protein